MLTHWGWDKMAAIFWPDDIFKCIFFDENVWIPIEVSLKFVPKGPVNNYPSIGSDSGLAGPGNKPLSEPMMVNYLTQWVKTSSNIVIQWHWSVLLHHNVTLWTSRILGYGGIYFIDLIDALQNWSMIENILSQFPATLIRSYCDNLPKSQLVMFLPVHNDVMTWECFFLFIDPSWRESISCQGDCPIITRVSDAVVLRAF